MTAVCVLGWPKTRCVCSNVQKHSELRQLRHQNHHLKQQVEQQRHDFKQQIEQQKDITVKLQDSLEVMAFHINKMSTINRGQLGCPMAPLQQTAQGSSIAGGDGSTAHHLQVRDKSNDESLTAAARQRRKADKRLHEQLLAVKQKALKLRDRQMRASHWSGSGADQTDADEEALLQVPATSSAQQPSLGQDLSGQGLSDQGIEGDSDRLPEQATEQSQSTRGGAPDEGAVAGTCRPSNLPIDMYPAAVKELMVPGRDDPVWTNWLGEFLNLNGMQRCQYHIRNIATQLPHMLVTCSVTEWTHSLTHSPTHTSTHLQHCQTGVRQHCECCGSDQ